MQMLSISRQGELDVVEYNTRKNKYYFAVSTIMASLQKEFFQ